MSDLPRLLFCCFDVVPGPSASSRRLTEYVKGLSERFQVVVLSVKTPDHPHIEKYHGARLLRVPVGAGDLTARAETFDRAVRRQLESEEYVLVHFFDPFGGYALAEKRAELGYTLVYDACVFPSIELPFDSPEPTNRRLTARCRRQELFCLMSSDAVIVGNPLTRDWVSTMGVERERVHVLLAPVDLTPYTPEAMGRPDGRPLRLVHLGSLCGSHGLSVLVEGMALVSPVERARLTLVGPANPQWRARLQHGAATRGLAGLVEFMGPVDHDEIHEVLATADVGALTLDDVERNRVVGSPLSRLGEYLAAGRPVLAADVPSARQLVPPEAAVWYRPSDPKSLADAIIALAADLPTRLSLGAAAREASARWDAAKIRADLVALYVSITGQPARRALEDDGETLDSNDITQLGPRAPRRDVRGGGANRALVARKESAEGSVGTDPVISAPEPVEAIDPIWPAGRTPVTPAANEPSRRGETPGAFPGPRESPGFPWAPDDPTDALSAPRPPSIPRAQALPPPLPEPRIGHDSSAGTASPVAQALTLTPLPRAALTSTLGIAPIPLPPISPPTPSRSTPPAISRTTPPTPVVTSVTPIPVASPPRVQAVIEEPLQVTDDEVHPVDAGDMSDEVNELLAADDVHSVEADASPPPSAIDPWLAQLVHGYCPPGSHLFNRPVPPTTMPGRDP